MPSLLSTLQSYLSASRARPAVRILDLAQLRRQRRRLEQLDDRLLADIGLTRDEAAEEARRQLWDVPQHWRA